MNRIESKYMKQKRQHMHRIHAHTPTEQKKRADSASTREHEY